jgi:SprT protein
MFLKKLYTTFFIISLVGIVLFIYILYDNYKFDNSKLSKDVQQRIYLKKQDMIKKIQDKYNIYLDVSIIIKKNIKGNLFGIATYNTKKSNINIDKYDSVYKIGSYDTKNVNIKIYLNKNHFKESLDYMIDEVLPHEYAHALMFRLNEFTNELGGHTQKWRDICIFLSNNRCGRYANTQDIVIEKTDFL